MKYTTTTFVDKSAPYIGPTYLNGLETQIEKLVFLSREDAVYNPTGSTSANYNLTVGSSTPTSDELPMVFVIVPTIANADNVTITPSWGVAAYPIKDYTTNTNIAAGTIKANSPVQLLFDGTTFWFGTGGGMSLQYGSTTGLAGFWDKNSEATPTATTPIVYNGYLRATKVYFGIWNDYAEYRDCADDSIAGNVVIELGNGFVMRSSDRLQPGGMIISDTAGSCMGQLSPLSGQIAVSGRVLAYVDSDKNSFKPGDPVCTGLDGTVSKMTREEVMMYPERIIGTVSEIPTYETWGNNVEVNGRIWIKVR